MSSINPQTLEMACDTLGHEQANGIVTVLGEKFGPFLADMILRWLLKRNFPSNVTAGLLSTTLVRRWLAQTLRDNKEEILAFINEHVASVFDMAVDALEGS